DPREDALVAPGVELRARRRELAAQAPDLVLRRGGHGLHLHERRDVGARLDARERDRRLHGAADDLAIGLAEEAHERAHLRALLLEARHADVHEVLGLLLAHAGRLAGARVRVGPAAGVGAERVVREAPRVGRERRAAREELALDLALRGLAPHLADLLRSAVADA